MHLCTKCECGIFSMDSKTPLRVHLSGFYKRSFAFYTIKERMPVILTKLIDYLVREKDQIISQYGTEAREELKDVIGGISKLKYEIQTNKNIPMIDSDEPDAKIYNQYLLEQSELDGKSRFFTAIWLHSECFMYRRIKNFFEATNSLKSFDYFKKQKQDSFHQSEGAIKSLGEYCLKVFNKPDAYNAEDELEKLLKLNLWGNRCDLSISAGEDNSQTSNPFQLVEKYEDYILVDQIKDIWKVVKKEKFNESHIRTIEFVNDNAGYEIFTDLCLADFLITFKFVEKINFNLKSIPWFISDTTPEDFRWVLHFLINSEDKIFKQLGIRWNKYVRENIWTYKSDPFWTLPYDFTRMESTNPELYRTLAAAKLTIFKGDLNYRKLLGEINWDPTTEIVEAVQNFRPGKMCILRTVKADIICGLGKGHQEVMDKKEPDWMTTGNYGVIQFVG